MTRLLRAIVAAAIVVLLVLHAIAWSPSQLLWACHLASFAIAIGIAVDRPWLIAVGVLFHVGEGIPAYVVDAITTGESTVISVLLHTIPVAAGVWALWGRPLPRKILIPAWLLHPGAMIAAYAFADPALDVMLVNKPWQTTAPLFPLSLVCIAAGWLVLRLVWKRWMPYRGPVPTLPFALLFQLAWGNLMKNRGIAGLLCAAVAAGVAFQIPNTANLAGYEAELVEQGTRSGLGDVRVRPRDGAWLSDADALAAELVKRPGVVAAVPAFVLPGAIGKRGNFKPAMILGIDERAPQRPFHVIAGAGVTAGDTTGIAVGTTIATRDAIGVGDEVQLVAIFSAAEQAIALDDNFGRYTMKVRGIIAGTFLGSEAIVVDRALLAQDLGQPHAASAIFVHLDDHADARAAAAAIERAIPGVEARAWVDDSQFLKSALAGSTAIRFVSAAMVVLAVSIPVWALLYVDVLHRRRQIAICMALGFRRLDMFLVYLGQAAIAGLIGVMVGCGLGYALIAWFTGHPIFESADFVIKPATSVWTFIGPAATLLAATLIASVIPAWRAARLAPARVLRGPE